MYIYPNTVFNDSLTHYGVQGMKWGVRRYDYVAKGIYKKGGQAIDKAKNRVSSGIDSSKRKLAKQQATNSSNDKQLTEEQIARREKLKKIAKYGAIGAGVALGAYGAYKIHSMNKEQQAKLLDTLSKIDKNVSTKGWDRKVQEKLLKEVNTASSIGEEATRMVQSLRSQRDNAMMAPYIAENLGWSHEQLSSHNTKVAAAFDAKKERAKKVAAAAYQLQTISKEDLDNYSQLDPRNVTKLQAASKTFKSSTGNVKKAISNATLTKAARAEMAKDAMEAERVKDLDRKIKDIQRKDAKKILQAYAKDPEAFINGDINIPDYAAISQNKIERLRKQILKTY